MRGLCVCVPPPFVETDSPLAAAAHRHDAANAASIRHLEMETCGTFYHYKDGYYLDAAV